MNSNSQFTIIHDLTNPETGNTYKEDNLKKRHNIPVGSLVEVKFDDFSPGGFSWKVHARMWVVRHDRDCDGTPLYTLSRWNPPVITHTYPYGGHIYADSKTGMSEDALTLVEITEDVRNGNDSLQWDDN